MLAICHFNLGNLTQATNDLTPAMELARSDRVFSIFLDKGDMVTRLLERLVFSPDLEETVRNLSRMMKDHSTRNAVPGDLVREYPHFMQLSVREKEILILLATHKTSVEIAEMLTLSANTIRFHIKSIYNKLDVHSRDKAVELGRELKIIE